LLPPARLQMEPTRHATPPGKTETRKETTMPTPDVKKEGWSWLINSSRDHYFVEGRSLCGKWGVLGYGDCNDVPTVNPPCATCRKKLERRKKEVES